MNENTPSTSRFTESSDDWIPKFKQYYHLLLKRKWVIILTLSLVMVVASVFTLRQPKIYEAFSTIIIEKETPLILKGIHEVARTEVKYWENKENMATYFKILKSRAVLQKVVTKLSLETNLTFLGLAGVQDSAKLQQALKKIDPVSILRSKIRIEEVRDSRVVNINIVDRDPVFAAQLSDVVAESFIENNLDMKLNITKEATDWLSDQIILLQKNLQSSEMALHEYRKKNNILSASIDDDTELHYNIVKNLSTNLSNTQAKRMEVESQRELLQKAIHENNVKFIESMSFENKYIDHLKISLSNLESEMAQIQTTYLPNHPKFQTISAKIQAVQDQIREELEKYYKSVDGQYQLLSETEKKITQSIENEKQKAIEIKKLEVEYSSLSRQKENDERLYTLVLERQKEADLTGHLKTNNITVLEYAQTPSAPIKPNVRLNLGIALLFGLLFGVGIAVILEFIDNTVKTQDDIENGIKLPFLGIIPSIAEHEKFENGVRIIPKREAKDLYIYHNNKSSVAECCRTIRTNLMFMSPDKPLRRFLVTSAGPKEGKSLTAVSLGITMAQAGTRTLLVDTDMRRPRLHRAFAMNNEKGVTSTLLGEAKLEDVIRKTPVPNLDVLTCGPIPPNPSELLHTKKFVAMVERLSEMYDRVLYDSPPVGAVTDALIISNLMDGVVLISKSGQTTKPMLKQSKKMLADVKANILGVVLNDLDLDNKGYGYYYYYYYYSRKYGYYYGESEKEAKTSTTA